MDASAIIEDRRDIDEVFELVRKEFTIKVEGGLNDFLGYEIIRDPEKKRCWILQNHLINKLIKNFEGEMKGNRKFDTSEMEVYQ